MNIRLANDKDFEKIWPIFNEIVSVGTTYTYPMNTQKNKLKSIG